MYLKKLFFVVFLISLTITTLAQSTESESKALIERLLPEHSRYFKIERLAEDSVDRFEIESSGDQFILRGNNGVAVASALCYYLTEYAHCQVTWNGSNLHLPDRLPLVPAKIVKDSPYKFRYYLNYCTFNYTMSWWDWPRWEKEIDWMALHGLNMPLAITGQEYTWYLVYKELGFTDEDLKGFFTGPAYFGWFWMGNLDGVGGPLPLSWMKNQMLLQQKIVTRQRALGMKPVLPAFTGHVPSTFKKLFPDTRLKATNWHNGFGDTYILDAEDPMFARIGKLFLKKQTELMGTDHFYSADTFNENEPPSNDPEYLGKLSARIYEGMRQADPEAVWVMQGWLFYSDRKFWGSQQTEGLLKTVPDDKMIILDLATEIEPVWKRTKAFYGKPWIWNMLNNFGGNTNMFGRMEAAATGPALAMQNEGRGKMSGIGLTMEATEQNPVLYELFTENVWRREPIRVEEWLPKYIRNRYGKDNENALKAWKILRNTVYTVPTNRYIRDGAESIFQARPTLDSSARWVSTKLNYRPEDLLPAWKMLVEAGPELKNSEGYRFDLTDLSRQVLANYALVIHKQIVRSYKNRDAEELKKQSDHFIGLISDLDASLLTQKDFLLGKWVSDARKLGTNEEEKALYERNAKNLITLWGDQECPLHEYSCRQWNGLLSDFYKPRWEQFLDLLLLDLKGEKKLDLTAFNHHIKAWEWKWVGQRKNYPARPSGNSVIAAEKLYRKYWSAVNNAY